VHQFYLITPSHQKSFSKYIMLPWRKFLHWWLAESYFTNSQGNSGQALEQTATMALCSIQILSAVCHCTECKKFVNIQLM